jgi:hypothetical protein
MTAASNESEASASRTQRVSTQTFALAEVHGGPSRADRRAPALNQAVRLRIVQSAAVSQRVGDRANHRSHAWVAYAQSGHRPMPDEASHAVSLPRRFSHCAVAAVIVATAGGLIGSNHQSPDQSRLNPETSTPADVNSAREGVVTGPVNAFKLMDARLVSSKPTMYGPTAWYPSPVANVSQVSVRSKLQALLMMLYSQSGVVDPAALEAKLQALLTLPDSVLAQLMEHPDLADLNKTLDAVFLGTTDLSGVKTELDKIDVISIPGPSEKIDVVNVNGKPAYIVHTSAVQMRTVDAAGSPVSAPPPPGGPVTVTVLSLVQAPASQIMSAFTVAPTSEQLPPPPAPASQIMSAFTVAPTSEQLPPPPSPTSTPTATTPTASEEPTGTPQTSNDVMTSGNKFEPGETATEHSVDNSPATNSPATQTAPPSTPPTGGESPAEAGGGGETSP